MKGSSQKNFHRATKPHFIKPLVLPGFQSKLSIPKPFLKKYFRGEKIDEFNGKFAKLRNNRVNKVWSVQMGFDDDDDQLYFRSGWQKFCEENGVKFGDFLAFKHHQNLFFDVLIFDPSCCERRFPGFRHPSQPSKKVNSVGVNKSSAKGFSKKVKGLKMAIKDKKAACSESIVNFEPRGHPYCHTIVKAHCLKWAAISLPMEFAKEHGLTQRWCNMTLIDQNGIKWPVHLRHRKGKSGCGVYIGKWGDFHRGNGLKNGDHVVFELIDPGERPVMNFYKLG